MKKLLAILLALVMIFSFATIFTACGDDDYVYVDDDDDDDDDDDSGKKKKPSDPSGETDLVGTWVAELDIGALLTSMMSSMSTENPLYSYFEFSPNSLTLTMTLNEDNTFTGSYGEGKLEQAINIISDDMTAAVTAYFQDAIAQQHLPYTPEQLAQMAWGMSIEAFVDATLDGSMPDILFNTITGTYEVKGDKLYFHNDNDDTEDSEDPYSTFELNGDELKITGSSSVEANDQYAEVFKDFVFYRQ